MERSKINRNHMKRPKKFILRKLSKTTEKDLKRAKNLQITKNILKRCKLSKAFQCYRKLLKTTIRDLKICLTN